MPVSLSLNFSIHGIEAGLEMIWEEGNLDQDRLVSRHLQVQTYTATDILIILTCAVIWTACKTVFYNLQMAFVSFLKIFITGTDGKLWFHTSAEIKSHNCRIQTIIETKVMSFISWIGIKEEFKIWKCYITQHDAIKQLLFENVDIERLQ